MYARFRLSVRQSLRWFVSTSVLPCVQPVSTSVRGVIEYTYHFLFVCNQFTDLRRDLTVI